MIDFIMMLALLPSFFLSLDAVVASVQPRSSMPSRGHQPRIPSWSTKFIASEATDAYTRCLRQNPQSPQFRVYQNVYFQQGRYYAIMPADEQDDPSMEDGLSPNNAIIRLPVSSLTNFTQHLRAARVKGNSLMLDFAFMSYPGHHGHWLETLVPIFNLLKDGQWKNLVQGSSALIDRVLMPNAASYAHDWMSNIFALAFSPGHSGSLNSGYPNDRPFIVDWQSLGDYDKAGWILFDNVIVAQDRYTHPQRKNGFINTEHGDLWRYDGCDRWVSPTFDPSFFNQEYARDFRSASFIKAKVTPPPSWQPGQAIVPKPNKDLRMVLMIPADKEPTIVNREELLEMLKRLGREFGLQVTSHSFTESSSFSSIVEEWSSAAVVVSRHLPSVASSIFMAPGSMLLELLPFKWEWHNLSMLYFNMTRSLEDIHHFGWRPSTVEAARYKDRGIAQAVRYKDWLPGECHAKECLSLQATADLVVDLEAVEEILRGKIPGVLKGRSVVEMAEAWPPAV